MSVTAFPAKGRHREIELPIRVLVADGDHKVREALTRMLFDAAFEVVGEASDGHEAVRLAAAMRPEVVLMDMRMPGLGGVEATAEITSCHPMTQVVILSAYEDAGLREGAETSGVCCYLVKGCRPWMVRDVVRSAGRLHRGLLARDRG